MIWIHQRLGLQLHLVLGVSYLVVMLVVILLLVLFEGSLVVQDFDVSLLHAAALSVDSSPSHSVAGIVFHIILIHLRRIYYLLS